MEPGYIATGMYFLCVYGEGNIWFSIIWFHLDSLIRNITNVWEKISIFKYAHASCTGNHIYKTENSSLSLLPIKTFDSVLVGVWTPNERFTISKSSPSFFFLNSTGNINSNINTYLWWQHHLVCKNKQLGIFSLEVTVDTTQSNIYP